MSSFNTVNLGGEYPYYANLDDSRLQNDLTINSIDFSQQSSTQHDKQITKKSLSQKKDESSDHSNLKTPEDQKAKTPRQKLILSLIPEYLAKRTQNEEINIYFFNSDKKMLLHKSQINSFFHQKPQITIRELIPFVLNRYCKLILNFQPTEIQDDSFELKLANLENKEDTTIDPFPHSLDISYLYDVDSLVLVRKLRSIDKVNDWTKLFGPKSQLQIIQILMPQKKQLMLQIEKNKRVRQVKEKIVSYSSQLGKIVLLSYYNFKLCEDNRKIVDLDGKIFQVYREKIHDYVDRPARKNTDSSFSNVKFYEDLWKNSSRNQQDLNHPLQFLVNETAIYGKLTLSLHKSEIIQKYTGGILSTYPFPQISALFSKYSLERTKTLSIHTLIGIKNTENEEISLKFMYKDRCEGQTYHFDVKDTKQNFLKNLLKIGRIYNKKWNKII